MNLHSQRKIVYLTAGAAGMFCGSCMHDNTLARALIRQGHDVQLVPTYTPIRTDEQDVSADQVFFGGINVFLQQKIPLFRYLPKFVDHWLDSPKIIRRVASRATNMKPSELGKLAVSMLKGRNGGQRKEVARLCNWLANESRPDLVLLTNILIGGCIPDIRQRLGIPVVVTLQGDDIFLDSLPEQYRLAAITEIQNVSRHVDQFVTHSHYYADFMSEYLSIPRSKIAVTRLGLDVDEFEATSNGAGKGESVRSENADEAPDQPQTIGYFARLAPEKGLHILIDAFIRLRTQAISETPSSLVPNAKLKIAGWLSEHNRDWAHSQFEKLNRAGLADQFQYLGSVDHKQKVEFLNSIDLLCVPTVYREPKGLYALEAMASGVPVVLPAHGAFPEMIADTQGGVLVSPESNQELADTLSELLTTPNRLSQLGLAGRESVRKYRNANAMASEMWTILEQVIVK